MYALFSSARSDAIKSCRLLAEYASIEPILEGCSYIGFIVQLQTFEFEKYLKIRPAVLALVESIEKRIEAQDFQCLYVHPASSELDPAGVPRVVFDPRGRVLYNW